MEIYCPIFKRFYKKSIIFGLFIALLASSLFIKLTIARQPEHSRDSTTKPTTQQGTTQQSTEREAGEVGKEKPPAAAEEKFEEVAEPPEFYLKQKQEAQKEGKPFPLGEIGTPTFKTAPPSEKVNFFVHPLPRKVNISPFPISGNKAVNSSVWLNEKKVIPESERTSWLYPTKLSLGENILTFSSKDASGKEIGRTQLVVSYEPPERRPETPALIGGPVASLAPAFFATPSAEVLTNPKMAPLFISPKEPISPPSHIPGSPKIFSSTHISQNHWSKSSSPIFIWEDKKEWTAFWVSLSRLPTDPSKNIGKKTNISYQNLEDGIWFFSLKAQNKDGSFTPTNFYRILIDRTPPKITNLSFLDVQPIYKNGALVNLKVEWTDDNFDSPFTEETAPLTFPLGFLPQEQQERIAPHKEDILSFARFVEADFSKIDSKFNKRKVMVSAPVKKGDHFEAVISYKINLENQRADVSSLPIQVKVQDLAGNIASSQVLAELANALPLSLTRQEEITQKIVILENYQKTGLTLFGTSLPNAEVTLSFYSEELFVATLRTDSNGNWTYTLRQPLPAGNHTIYAQAKDQEGNTTPTTQIGSFSLLPQVQAAEVERLATRLAQIATPAEELIPPRERPSPEEEVKPITFPILKVIFASAALLFVGGLILLFWILKRKPV